MEAQRQAAAAASASARELDDGAKCAKHAVARYPA